MLQFKVDTEKCIQCGECVEDCLFGVLGMEEYPAVLSSVLPGYARKLGIPADHQIVCVMSFGKPAVNYRRTVQRPGGVIRRADL